MMAALNVPGSHRSCAVEPVEQADPVGQSVQLLAAPSPGVLEYVPAKQGSAAAAPAAQWEPDGHSRHAIAPVADWYFPGSQLIHVG